MRFRARQVLVTTFLLTAAGAGAQELPGVGRVSLDAAIQQALQHNPTVRAGVANVKLAYAQMEEIRASSLPTLTVNGNYTRLDADRVLSSNGTRVVVEPANQFSGNISLALPLLNPRAWANWARAADQVDVSRLSFWDTQRLVALATARAYLTVYLEHLNVDLNLRARENARAHLNYAQKRLQGEIGNRLDVVRAAQEVSSDESLLQTTYANLARAREALGVLMGVNGTAVDVTEQPPEGQLPEAPGLDMALAGARRGRTDVKVGEERVHAADRSLHWSYTEYLPTLSAVLQPFAQSFQSITSPTTGWQGMLLLTLPLYDGGYRYGVTHEREANLGLAQLNLEATVRQAESDARAAFEALQRAQSSFNAAKDAARLAHEALSLADLSYRAGATNELDVIDAERRARDADNAAASAEDAALQAQLDLLNASGVFPRPNPS